MNHVSANTAQLMHDLQVHQIELQQQNEELRQTQLALEMSRARYFDLYDLAPVGYLTVAASGLILEANLCAATLLGVTRNELVKRSFNRFIAKTHQDSYYQCHRQLLETGQEQTCELLLLQSNGSTLWVNLNLNLNLSSVPADAYVPELRMVLSDISEKKRLDAALLQTNHNLENACLQADRANLAKSEFLSNMSHELRSPLSAILGFAQLMEASSPPPTPRQQASLEQILKGGWYLLALINEILDLASIESGHTTLTMGPVPLAAMLLDCQALIDPLAEQSAVHVHYPELEATCVVHADPIRLKQVIINLLSNAIKYNRQGGTVDVTCSTLANRRLRISVHDTGEGLSAAQLAQLFQPFNRLGQESGATKGTGIGLVVSQRLVQSMGGEMGVSSTVGQGSVFWFELNVANQVPAATALPQLPEQVPPAHSQVMRSVLYVEDNPANRALIEQLLAAHAGLNLLVAQDAMLGIAMARSFAPAVIVMDIQLPGINGIDALKILQADPATAHIPVLALSANAMPHDIEKGLAAGFYGYLTKPIKINEFMAALEQGLALAAQR